MKKKSKLKEYIKIFKEIWSIPKYRAIIKLSLYGIMFLIIVLLANTYQSFNVENNETDNTKTYAEILKSIDLENCEIEYLIKTLSNEYKIEGKIKDNLLSGYIENNSIIKKISIKENNIYQIINNVETLDVDLNNNIVAFFLLPKNIIELVNSESAYIEKNENSTSYSYQINYNNTYYTIKLTTDLENLTNISINNNIINYNMKVNFDKNI